MRSIVTGVWGASTPVDSKGKAFGGSGQSPAGCRGEAPPVGDKHVDIAKQYQRSPN